MPLTFPELAAAGADIRSPHGEAWTRHPRVVASDRTLLAAISRARLALSRAVVPADLDAPDQPAPLPPWARTVIATGVTVPGVDPAALARAVKGEPLTPRIRARILAGLTAPSLDPITPPAPKPRNTMSPETLYRLIHEHCQAYSKPRTVAAAEIGVHVGTLYRLKRGETVNEESMAKIRAWIDADHPTAPKDQEPSAAPAAEPEPAAPAPAPEATAAPEPQPFTSSATMQEAGIRLLTANVTVGPHLPPLLVNGAVPQAFSSEIREAPGILTTCAQDLLRIAADLLPMHRPQAQKCLTLAADFLCGDA